MTVRAALPASVPPGFWVYELTDSAELIVRVPALTSAAAAAKPPLASTKAAPVAMVTGVLARLPLRVSVPLATEVVPA